MNAGLNIMNMFGWNNPASMMGMNPYGCGNSSMLSIFGNGFGCNAEYNAGAYIGMSFAPMVLQCITGAIGSGVRTAKDNSDATLARDKGAVLKDIGSKINQLSGVKGAENLKPETIAIANLSDLKPADRFDTAINNIEKQINEYQKPVKPTGSDATDNTKLAEYNTKLAEYHNHIKELQEQKAEAEAARTAEQKRIDGIKAELTALIQERDNIQKEIDARQAKADDKALRRGDGNSITRCSDEDFNKAFTAPSGTTTTWGLASGKTAGNVTVAEFRALINRYVTADESQKPALAKFIKELWCNESLDTKIKNNREIFKAYNAICKKSS